MSEKSLKYYMDRTKGQRLSKGKDAALKVALLSSFSINGLKEVMVVKCNELSLDCEIYEADYNQISQEVVDEKSGLNKFRPSISFLLINPKHILGGSLFRVIQSRDERKRFIEEKTAEFIQTINLFVKNVSGILVVSNLKAIPYSPLGINDEKTEMSTKDMANYFNRRLKEEFIKNNRVFVYDFAGFFTRFGECHVIDEKLNYLGDILVSPDYIPVLAEDLMAYVKAYCSKNRKCIVLDLDNTLWGGIVGEDGFNNIKLDDKPPGNAFVDFQKHLLGLHKRGIILAVNSRNNPEDALKVIRQHPYMVLREEHFAAMKINWNDKVSNMKEIAGEINIGTDSLVFIDDDPVNRALVKQAMPEVLVVDLPDDPAMYARTLREMNDFNTLQLTEEDFKKGGMYYQQRKRTELKSSFTDLQSFLKTLNIEVEIKEGNDFTIPRIAQLTQKTSQFNLTTRRYSESDIKRFCESPGHRVYSVNVRDKFGDSGLTGAIVLAREGDAFKIDTFLLSCRVIGKGVEKAMLFFLAEVAQKNKVLWLIGEYIPTQKNKPCEKMYEENGFERLDKNLFKLSDFEGLKPVDYIRVEAK